MTLPQTRLRLSLCAAVLGATACVAAGPPVQEMSDARQAIAAAREAGAATLDGEGLRNAEVQLAGAEAQLQRRVYRDAKRLAVSAKETAAASLLRSRSRREEAASPAPGSAAAAAPAVLPP